MKKTAFALALLLSGTAFAQTTDTAATNAYEGDGAVTNVYETEGGTGGAYVDPTVAAAVTTMATDTTETAQLVQPSNASPERDARGIAVISAEPSPGGLERRSGGRDGGPSWTL